MAVESKQLGSQFFYDSDQRRYLLPVRWLNILLIDFAVLTAVIGTYGYVAPLAGWSQGHASPISMIAGVVLAAVVIGGIQLAKTKPTAGYIVCALGPLAALGQFANLVAAIGQHGQKAVFLLGVPINIFFACVKELGRAFRCQLESGFG